MDFTIVVRGDEYFKTCTLCRIDNVVGYQRHLGLFAAVQSVDDDDHARPLPGEGVQTGHHVHHQLGLVLKGLEKKSASF